MKIGSCFGRIARFSMGLLGTALVLFPSMVKAESDGQLENMIQLFDTGTFYGLCRGIGQAFEKRGQHKKALEYYQQGAEKAHHVGCLIETARMYSNDEHGISPNIELAKQYLKSALHKDEYNPVAHYNAGILHYQLKEDRLARSYFAMADRLGFSDAREMLGYLKNTEVADWLLEGVIGKGAFSVFDIALREQAFKHGLKLEESGDAKTGYSFKSGDAVIRITSTEVSLKSKLSAQNAMKFGRLVNFVQGLLYVDVPPEVMTKSNDALTSLMFRALTGKSVERVEFEDRLVHLLDYNYGNQQMVYKVSVNAAQ